MTGIHGMFCQVLLVMLHARMYDCYIQDVTDVTHCSVDAMDLSVAVVDDVHGFQSKVHVGGLAAHGLAVCSWSPAHHTIPQHHGGLSLTKQEL